MNRFFKSVLLTSLFVGTTDIISAFINLYIGRGQFPDKMFLYIAGGLLGLGRSLKGGVWTNFLGLFFHYFIAFAATLFFYWIFPKLKFLAFNKYLVGTLYAVFVNQVIQLIIVTLTSLPAGGPFDLARALIGWYTFAAVFGIPVAYNTYRYYNVRSEA